MLNQNFGDWSAIGKAFAAPFAEIHSIHSRIVEQLTREHIDMASSNLASAIKHMQTSFKTKEAEDFVKLQMDFVTDMSSKCLGYSKDICKIVEGAIKDYSKWGEDHAAEALKKAGLSHSECCNKTKN